MYRVKFTQWWFFYARNPKPNREISFQNKKETDEKQELKYIVTLVLENYFNKACFQLLNIYLM